MNILHKRIILILILLTLFSAVLCGCSAPLIAYAESGASSVLDDLQKDEAFDTSLYPLALDDYSLKLIQLAESVNNELFVYVYQPSGQAKNLTASSINISTTINDDISFYNYKLQLLNSNGVFYKYLVKDFTVKSDPTRYYAVSSIYRPFDASIDATPGDGNVITEIDYPVNKQYAFSMINGKPFCSVVDIETIVVTDKFVGFVRYSDGYKFFPSACDSHFVAFNTDKPIDKLLEADVYYTNQYYGWLQNNMGQVSESFGEKSDAYAYLKYTDKVEHTGNGLFAGTYRWDRIETVEQFVSENDLTQNVYSGAIIDVKCANKITDEGKAALQGKKWVLRFADTAVTTLSGFGTYSLDATLVGDVTILRLKFETDGITYNLGVIDNKQTGSDKPINNEEIKPEINDSGKIILGVLLALLLIILLYPVLPYIVKFIGWLIMLPFRIIGALFTWIKNAVNASKAKKEAPEGTNNRTKNKKRKRTNDKKKK